MPCPGACAGAIQQSRGFEALALRNGSDKRNSDTDFRDGDDMRLYFLAPVDGYVAVYLVGVDRQVYSLLPYMDDDDGRMPVKHGREYVFFDASRKYDGAGTVDELYLNTDRPQELNQLLCGILAQTVQPCHCKGRRHSG